MRREPPPPGMVAAAEQEYHAMRIELSRLLNAVRPLLSRAGFSEVEAVTDVWLTLLQLNRPNCAFLGAVAVVQIAKADGPAGPRASEPGGRSPP